MNESFFHRAILLARKGVGHTSPNPAVGAVLVKDGTIIGQGWHKRAGLKHAEVVAIDDARAQGHVVEGAELYNTLEPCRHTGKTAPCTDVIARAGIARVYVGMRDPHMHVHGQGIAILNRRGIDTDVLDSDSDLAAQIRFLNQPFLKWASVHLPYVTLKAAVSLDGRIATHAGASKWITQQASRLDARLERSRADAVIVGAGTVEADNPELASHGEYTDKRLLRVVISPLLRLDPSLSVFRDQHIFVATTFQASAARKALYDKHGISYRAFGPKRVVIKRLLQYLGQQEITHVFVEGGAGVHGSFVDESLFDPLIIDRVLWYISPRIIGGVASLASVGGTGAASIEQSLALRRVEVSHSDGDIKVEGIINNY
jgi:diaminohydroxyphosphoribosylaminopyrimidine deaminase / 5-amino-6-(5-phosphoribosylamino)uracil reductase